MYLYGKIVICMVITLVLRYWVSGLPINNTIITWADVAPFNTRASSYSSFCSKLQSRCGFPDSARTQEIFSHLKEVKIFDEMNIDEFSCQKKRKNSSNLKFVSDTSQWMWGARKLIENSITTMFEFKKLTVIFTLWAQYDPMLK